MFPPHPTPPHDPRDSNSRLDAERRPQREDLSDIAARLLIYVVVSIFAGLLIFVLYSKFATFELYPCHSEGGTYESVGTAAAICVGLWLLGGTLAILLRRRSLPLVFLGIGFVLLYVAGLVALANVSPYFWGPEHCTAPPAVTDFCFMC